MSGEHDLPENFRLPEQDEFDQKIRLEALKCATRLFQGLGRSPYDTVSAAESFVQYVKTGER